MKTISENGTTRLDIQTDSESTEVGAPPFAKTAKRMKDPPLGQSSENGGNSSIASPVAMLTSYLPSPFKSSKQSNNSNNGNNNTNSIRSAGVPTTVPEDETKTDLPVSLEGTLSFRKGKTAKDSKSWKSVYVVLNLTNDGSITCYAPIAEKKGNPTVSSSNVSNEVSNLRPRLHLPAYVNWMAKDIANNTNSFVIEVNTIDPTLHVGSLTTEEGGDPFEFYNSNNNDDDGSPMSSSMRCLTGNGPPIPLEIQEDIKRAREKQDNFRVYFRCGRSGNEKVLWLRAFEQIDRLSFDLHKRKGIIHNLANPTLTISHSRVRSDIAQRFAREGKVLDDASVSSIHTIDDPGSHLRERSKMKNGGEKEYMVYPTYAYPNRWMTDSELYNEMLKPSEVFHDTRVHVSDAPQKEIGVLKVELLQCIGLPALDFASETDATAYMVCGSHAFTTDVIWNRLNPMWLPRSRRACTFPIYHAYARLFVGVFDDDGKGEKDDFAGRVVIDLARCRPRSTYDATMPLRLSAAVYSRRPRGSIRLRFSLEWHSERDALLSYIPKQIRPPGPRPDDDVTVLCADEKAFRNIVTTVHGIHMPGRFSFSQWKATMREAMFARKTLEVVLRRFVIDIVIWQNPSLSMLVFCSWMYIIYRNSFALVPLHLMSFLTLMMMRTYVFFGTDGPIQQGFIPPSWEEMAMALAKDSKSIQPLKVKPIKHGPSGSFRTIGTKMAEPPETHKPRGKWFFRLLGFKNAKRYYEPNQYHMEFPFSQGKKDPTTDSIQYPKFKVKESLVSKSSLIHRRGSTTGPPGTEDGDGDMLGDLLSPMPKKKNRKFSAGSLNRSKHNGSAGKEENAARALEETFDRSARNFGFEGVAYEDLPPYLRIPEQDIDAKGPAKKKKLADELNELQENMHKVTLHIFNDRTHVIRHPQPLYFGQASKAGLFQSDNVQGDLERLLNVGQFSSANPVVARVGTYVEPIIHAATSGLGLYRSVYNIVTWRDPMLSFWVSLIMLAAVVVLAIFPWRLFFFVLGLVLVGPQNWIVRKMEQRGTTPTFIKKRLDKLQKRKKKRKRGTTLTAELPKGQPVIGCHTSDNSPPAIYNPDEVDAREIHQVCVPYTQLMTQRFYDWPPEPQYAKCEPTEELENEQRRRSASFGLRRGSSNIVRRTRGARRQSHFLDSSSRSLDPRALSRSTQRRATG